ncbi:hypothetical protein SCUCBS95973_008768 [Sporothrix curviconia]|uniref:Lea domain containing protein n=1 Tax=Sporothrix curviconia TaxID=1260050 RepID=A0ABP0CP92_9PEZI
MTSPTPPPKPPVSVTPIDGGPGSSSVSLSPDTSDHEYDDPPEEEIIESEHSPKLLHPTTEESVPGEPRVKTNFRDRGRTPAHVTPISKIGCISPMSPVAPAHGISTHSRPSFPLSLTSRFTGKTIDEYGEVHEHSGPDDASDVPVLLGRVAGDLPAMVGRTVSNDKGDVLDDDGTLLGYIQDIEGHTPSQSLDEYTGGVSSGFRVDAEGQIFDASGNAVGHMNQAPKGGMAASSNQRDGTKDEKKSPAGEGQPPSVNAESFQQGSPSDIFLDVKSTTEGIQLTIRIPTVFPGSGQPPRVPKVSFA